MVMIVSLVENTHCVPAACIICFMSHESPIDTSFHFPRLANDLEFKQGEKLGQD